MDKDLENSVGANAISRSETAATLKIIQEYTESVENRIETGINSLNTKLTSLLAFSGILMQFAGDLDGACSGWKDIKTWSIYEKNLTASKVLCCLFLFISILSALYGLISNSNKKGKLPDPVAVIKKLTSASEIGSRKRLTKDLANSLAAYKEYADRKEKLFFYSVIILTIALGLFVLNIMMVSFNGPISCPS